MGNYLKKKPKVCDWVSVSTQCTPQGPVSGRCMELQMTPTICWGMNTGSSEFVNHLASILYSRLLTPSELNFSNHYVPCFFFTCWPDTQVMFCSSTRMYGEPLRAQLSRPIRGYKNSTLTNILFYSSFDLCSILSLLL